MSAKLLDAVIAKLNLKNDAQLSRALEIGPDRVSNIRHNKSNVGSALVIRIHKLTKISVEDIEAMIGDKS